MWNGSKSWLATCVFVISAMALSMGASMFNQAHANSLGNATSLQVSSQATLSAPDPLAQIFSSQPQFLPVDDAFMFEHKQNGGTVTIDFTIAEDYYLYADKFQFKADGAEIVEIIIPPATQIEDEFFGISDVFFFEAKPVVKLANITSDATLTMRFQGCAKAGFCYNPETRVLQLSASEASGSGANKAGQSSALNNGADKTTSESNVSLQDSLAEKLQSESLLWTLLVFFGLGVGLALTPCVFPMFPILSSIIAGQKNLTLKKGLWLAFVYVQGMALTYSLLGLVVASLGVQFQATLQHPAILIAVSLIFIGLAGAMFGWYNLQLPESWTNKLTKVSNEQKSGQIVGVFVMGLLSGLIASPCTTAPLTGALLYVAQTGDLVIGFVTLYALSLGMGLPLLLIGASGGSLMPKAGNWMNIIKHIFGFILLAIPLILLERFLPIEWIMILGGILLIAFASYLYSIEAEQTKKVTRSIVWIISVGSFLSGFTLIERALFPAAPVQVANVSGGSQQKGAFQELSTLAELQDALVMAQQNGQPVMVDLVADWCFACTEFELLTFSDAAVKARMQDFVLIKIDVTENNADDIEVLEAFNVLGLPTILFFDKNSRELTQQRVTGFMNAETFLAHLNSLPQT